MNAEVDYVGLGVPQTIHCVLDETTTVCGQAIVVLGRPESYPGALLVRSRWKGSLPGHLPLCSECADAVVE